MKKLFTLCLSFLLGGMLFSAQAQTVDPADYYKFVDADGNVISSGSVLTFNKVEYIASQQSDGITSHLYVKFMPETRHDSYVGVRFTVKSITSGTVTYQCCFGGNCANISYNPPTVEPNIWDTNTTMGHVGFNELLQDEFLLNDNTATSEAEVDYQIMCYSDAGELLAAGDKITLRYTTTTTGIDGVTSTESNEVVARYTLDGQKISAPQKGINIVKYADGRTEKVLVK